MTKSKDYEKLKELVESEGYSNTTEWLQDNMFKSVVMGICTNPTCDYTTDVEPDNRRGWCEICNRKSVASGLVLAGY